MKISHNPTKKAPAELTVPYSADQCFLSEKSGFCDVTKGSETCPNLCLVPCVRLLPNMLFMHFSELCLVAFFFFF